MERTVATLVDAGARRDPALARPGAAAAARPGRRSRRSSCAPTSRNVYGPEHPGRLFSELVAGAVEQALVLDAACVVVNLLQLPGEPELLRECVRNVTALKAACEPVGMPLMVEPLVVQGRASAATAPTATRRRSCRSSARRSSSAPT